MSFDIGCELENSGDLILIEIAYGQKVFLHRGCCSLNVYARMLIIIEASTNTPEFLDNGLCAPQQSIFFPAGQASREVQVLCQAEAERSIASLGSGFWFHCRKLIEGKNASDKKVGLSKND